MKKLPYAFKNTVRSSYFDLLRRIVEREGLILDMEKYREDSILSKGGDHSRWGEPDDLTNEYTPRGLNGRDYDGLKIMINNNKYKQQLEIIGNNMKSQLEEDVVVGRISDEIKIVFG